MLRNGLRHCAQRATSAASASTLLRTRAALSVPRLQVSFAVRPLSSFKPISSAARAYSTEADASAELVQETAAPGEVTKFRDLAALGVHNNLLSSIIDGMGYESMTQVQAKTINPALKGTDM